MMKRKTLTTLLLYMAIYAQCGWAQNTVASIRQRYAAIKEQIAKSDKDEYFKQYYHVEASHNLPATGPHKEDVYMYFDEKESNEDRIYAEHSLKFVTTKYNYAVREYYEEYLYDADGNVAFIYAVQPWLTLGDSTDGMDYEFRYYFSKGKLLQTIVKKSVSGKGQFVEEYSGATVKEQYRNIYQNYLYEARKFKKLFEDVEQATYNYSE
jgi:hypothetical protein